MRRFLIFLGVIVVLGCQEPKSDYPIPNKTDINEIIKAVIAKDSLFNHSIPLYPRLNKLKIVETDNYLPSPFGSLNIRALTDSVFFRFNNKDKPYLLFQNDNLKKFTIDTTQFKDIIWIDSVNIKQKTGPNWSHYQFSIPIFSTNQKKALIEFDRKCSSCGEGFYVMLNKVNGNWKVISFITAWIN